LIKPLINNKVYIGYFINVFHPKKIDNDKLDPLMDSLALLKYLDRLSIQYEYHDHVAVFTSEQARRLIPPLAGASAKNLFLRDRKGRRHFLLSLPDDKILDLKSLAVDLMLSGLSLASPERLQKFLGITPGAVSILALVNDTEINVEVLVDQDLWQTDKLQCHPLVNTATLVISLQDINKFLDSTNHSVQIVNINPPNSQNARA
jgi:Ala-tRNA(Pro) deacylase